MSPDDPRIQAGPVEFATAATTMMGYLSRPRDAGPNPAILVIHENRGMQPHFPDVTRRYALQGYTALSVDLLSRKGGTGVVLRQRPGQGRAAGDYSERFPHRLTRQRGLSPDAFPRQARPDRGYWVLFWWRVDLVDVGAEPGDRGGGSLLWLGPAFGRSPQPERARAGHLWGRRRTDQLWEYPNWRRRCSGMGRNTGLSPILERTTLFSTTPGNSTIRRQPRPPGKKPWPGLMSI